MCIFLFWLADIIISILTKITLKKFGEKVKNFESSSYPNFVFDQKLFITFFLLMSSLHKLHSHVLYKEVY